MIYLRNEGDYVVHLKIKGLLSTSGAQSYDFSEPMPFPGFIKAVWAYENTAGTTGTESVDLTKNGSSLVSSGTLFSFATTAKSATYGTLTTTPTTVAKGDILALSVTTVHTTTAGTDLVAVVVIGRERGVITEALQTGTFSSDLDAIA
jgi:hypothetical protein